MRKEQATDAVGDGQPWWRSTVMHREMAYVGGALYAAGGWLVLLTVLLPSWRMYSEGLVTFVGVAAIVVGAFYAIAADRLPMPVWTYAIATSTGAILVTIAALGGGAETTSTYGVLYVFVSTYGFYYYPWPVAAWLVVLNGAGFAGVLAFHEVDQPLTEWFMIIGASVLAGGLIGTLGRRVRHLFDLERENVRVLNEVDAWKTTFLRAAAHDLRSPLTAIHGTLNTMRDHDERLSEEQRRDLVERAIRSSQRLQGLVSDLLDMERIEAGEITPRRETVRLDELVRSVVTATDPRGRTVEIDAPAVTASVEPAKVERIVDNLVRNAVTHTNPDSRVLVRVADHPDHTSIEVLDDGPGLPAEHVDRLFEAFRGRLTDQDDHASIGLGLHLVRQFTRLHGGTCLAGNRPGGGAAFEVRLPKVATDEPADPSEPDVPAATSEPADILADGPA